ncbi:hypothetical protein Sjap_006499 [Stephania japonica]|uniref:Chlorophyllase n=1 Tax=Stephania japonica TaxID=461633 RepID=A0AAP0K5X5_9MAGN
MNQQIKMATHVKVVKHASSTSSTSVFELGSFSVEALKLKKLEHGCPSPLLILSPKVDGQYPVLVFINGFGLENSDYTVLLTHVASHGFIVAAPQVWTITPSFDYGEMDCVVNVTNWLSDGLPPLLPPKVEPNLQKLGLCGHSRGGKTAFSLIASKSVDKSLNFSALIGVDPVMGFAKVLQTQPDLLTFKPNSLDMGMPVMVVGMGLSSEWNVLCPPCSPAGVNHQEVYSECQAPCYHFVAKDFGHMDVIDDNPEDPIGAIASCMCKKGDQGRRDLLRRCVGGLIVAFLEANWEGESGDLNAVIDDPDIAPVAIDRELK